MIVSHEWLKEYVPLDMPVDELTDRLTMSGLNLESTESIDGDCAIDLEVTSNRADCLGHIGVAREVSVLFDKPLKIKGPYPSTCSEKTADATSVTLECDDLCPQYTARVIRGIRIGPSPDWLQRRLQAIGIAVINNVVDITNYVMFECGQPLHAFDFHKLHGNRIVVRRAQAGEKIVAIDQREYALQPDDCVIADADRPVAIAGVMGGFDTEISDATTDVLIETASFAPLTVRSTARRLGLHSPSSFRFERTVDRVRMDWASRRCCELILELAGGELLDTPVVAGAIVENRRVPIPLRFNQIRRVLGIDIDPEIAMRILTSLGLKQHGGASHGSVNFEPPSWRRDLEREIDLIEEIGRIHGYENIPDNAPLPIVSTSRSRRTRVTDRIRDTLTALGFFEAITLSFVSRDQAESFTPRGVRPLLHVDHSSRRHENQLRQSVVPSLLESRRVNERQGAFGTDLFEIAKVYLDADSDRNENEAEPTVVGLVGSKSFAELKGVVESVVRRLNPATRLDMRPADVPQFVAGRGAEIRIGNQRLGVIGELDVAVTDRIDLRDAVTVAEMDLHLLEALANLIPEFVTLPVYPTVSRDLNFVLDDAVTWEQVAAAVRASAGPLLDSVAFGGQYRGKQIADGHKSYVVTIHYRSADRTLTAEEVDRAQHAVIGACAEQLGATLRQ